MSAASYVAIIAPSAGAMMTIEIRVTAESLRDAYRQACEEAVRRYGAEAICRGVTEEEA